MGHVIFNLQFRMGHSVLCQMEGVGRVFSNHHILKCSGPPPPPLFFLTSPLYLGFDIAILWTCGMLLQQTTAAVCL